MISSLLLHIDGAQSVTETIQFGVELATQQQARVQGLMLLDTRRLEAMALSTESALGCSGELERLAQVDLDQRSVQDELAAACMAAEVPCSVSQLRGDPLSLLPCHAQFHDLIVTTFPAPKSVDTTPGSLSAGDVVRIVESGVHPLLVMRPQKKVQRVLLIGDGSWAAAAAIRQFLAQRLFPTAELRVLAVGDSEAQARERLGVLSAYLSQRRLAFESGCLRGSLRQVLLPYAEKWDADLVVMGIAKRSSLLRPLLQDPIEQLLRKTNLGLYTLA